MAFPLRKMMMSRGRATPPDSANMSVAVGESLGILLRRVTKGDPTAVTLGEGNQKVCTLFGQREVV